MTKYLRQGKTAVEVGELRERVSICIRKTEVNRKTGIEQLVYEPVLTTRAKVIGESGREFLGADRDLQRVRKRIFIRRRKGLKVTEDHFILYEDQYYTIYDKEDYDVMFYEFRVERVEK